MKQAQVIDFARQYLYTPTYPSISYGHTAHYDRWKKRYEYPLKEKVPLEALTLNRNLQYYLCHWYDRFSSQFDEVLKKDVAQAVEAWIFAHEKDHHLEYNEPYDPNYQALFDENGELKK